MLRVEVQSYTPSGKDLQRPYVERFTVKSGPQTQYIEELGPVVFRSGVDGSFDIEARFKQGTQFLIPVFQTDKANGKVIGNLTIPDGRVLNAPVRSDSGIIVLMTFANGADPQNLRPLYDVINIRATQRKVLPLLARSEKKWVKSDIEFSVEVMPGSRVKVDLLRPFKPLGISNDDGQIYVYSHFDQKLRVHKNGFEPESITGGRLKLPLGKEKLKIVEPTRRVEYTLWVNPKSK